MKKKHGTYLPIKIIARREGVLLMSIYLETIDGARSPMTT